MNHLALHNAHFKTHPPILDYFGRFNEEARLLYELHALTLHACHHAYGFA